jgi:hypothetical protein
VQVAHGELTEAPLETLSALAQSVFLPLLTARINQEGWPDVVAQEVSDSMHRLVATGALAAMQQFGAKDMCSYLRTLYRNRTAAQVFVPR